MASVIAAAVSALMEINEVEAKRLSDGRLQTVFITSGVSPEAVKLKTLLWSLAAPPVQRPEDVRVEELQAGPLHAVKRYRITVTLRPLHEALRRGGGLGFRETLLGGG